MATSTTEERNNFRIHVTDKVVGAGDHHWTTGAVGEWTKSEDKHTKAVLKGLNGPLLYTLINMMMAYVGDSMNAVVDSLLGAPLVGEIPSSGRGRERPPTKLDSVEALWEGRAKSNRKTVESLRVTEVDEVIQSCPIEGRVPFMSSKENYGAR